jgi:tetratricopeptide (TPR) repeat protein
MFTEEAMKFLQCNTSQASRCNADINQYKTIQTYHLLTDDNIVDVFLQAKCYKNPPQHLLSKIRGFLEDEKTKTQTFPNLLLANIAIFIKDSESASFFIEKYKVQAKTETKLTGKIATAKFFSNIENTFLALEITNDDIKNRLKDDCSNKVTFYENDRLKYKDLTMFEINEQTQALLFTEIEYILLTERDPKYLQEKLQVYLDWLEYKRENNPDITRRLLAFYKTFIDPTACYDLAFHIDQPVHFRAKDAEMFPINKLTHDLQIQAANGYLKLHRYDLALKLFTMQEMTEEIIRCYIGLNKEKLAIQETKERILKLDLRIQDQKVKIDSEYHTSSFHDRYAIYNCYMLLAGLIGKIEYYDHAFKWCAHSEPLRLKAIKLFDKQQYEPCRELLYQALGINYTEKILYTLSCTQIRLQEYEQAIAILRQLLLFSPRNCAVLRNLALCYLELNKIEKCLETLAEVIRYENRTADKILYSDLCSKHSIESRFAE